MERVNYTFDEMLAMVPQNIKQEVNLEFAISNRIHSLMTARGLTKAEFARQIGRRPSEVTKWLSGQYNFTLSTIAAISSFFGEPLVDVAI